MYFIDDGNMACDMASSDRSKTGQQMSSGNTVSCMGESPVTTNVSRMSGNDYCGLIEVDNIKKNAVNSRCIAAVVKNFQIQTIWSSYTTVK